MILSIVTIALVAGLGYLWMNRGFFSAFLNLICVIAAGAIAFALFEPIGYLVLEKAPTTGSMSAFSGAAWAIGLAVPFAVSLALLRTVVDKAVGANVAIKTPINYAGGAVCGAAGGVITAGIVVLSVGFLRVDQDFMGFQPVNYGSDSSLVRSSSLILPVDRITAKLYGMASETSLASDEPLARWYPAFADVSATLRMNQGGGAGKNTIKKNDFQVIGRYTVGGDKSSLTSLLADAWTAKSQSVTNIDGQAFPPTSHLEGFVVEFTSGAKEKNGQVVFRSGQLNLVSESADGSERITAHPIAVVTRAQLAKINYARFRYDTRDLDIASVNGDSAPKMGFEFVVPNGFRPIAFNVKNVRYTVPEGKAPLEYPTTAARDAGIKDGTLLKTTVDPEERGVNTPTPTNSNNKEDDSIAVQNFLPNRRVIQDGQQHGLGVGIPYVTEGRGVYGSQELDPRQVPKELKIDRFEVSKDTVIVQVNVSRDTRSSMLSKAAEAADNNATPHLVSADGQAFEAVGYWYEDKEKIMVRYTPGEPVRAIQELVNEGVALTKSRADQTLILIFRPTLGVELVNFSLGNVEVNKFEKPIKLENTQK